MNSCNLNLTYNDDTWAAVVSPDQEGCNNYIRAHKNDFLNTNAFHIGTGTSSVFIEFHDLFSRLDGLTIMQSEIDVAHSLKFQDACQYNVFNFNKYDVHNFKEFPKDYSLIIDNNLSHYACCQKHWEAFFIVLTDMLLPGGCILTHSQGFMPHTQNVGPLTIPELKTLSADKLEVSICNELINSYGHCPVIIRKK